MIINTVVKLHVRLSRIRPNPKDLAYPYHVSKIPQMIMTSLSINKHFQSSFMVHNQNGRKSTMINNSVLSQSLVREILYSQQLNYTCGITNPLPYLYHDNDQHAFFHTIIPHHKWHTYYLDHLTWHTPVLLLHHTCAFCYAQALLVAQYLHAFFESSTLIQVDKIIPRTVLMLYRALLYSVTFSFFQLLFSYVHGSIRVLHLSRNYRLMSRESNRYFRV